MHDTTAASRIQVSLSPDLPASVAEYAREKVAVLFGHTALPVHSARVRVTTRHNPAASQPVTAQAVLDLRGHVLCVRVGADTAREAVDRVEDKLRRRMEHEAGRGHRPRPGTAGRTAGWPTPPPGIARHKEVVPQRLDCAEAAEVMAAMDYDFHLFVERGTGQDSVLNRSAGGGFTLTQMRPRPAQVDHGEARVHVDPHPAPRLTVAGASDRLTLAGLPFVFFADAETGRGRVLYRRHDGGLALITPRL